MAPRRLDTGDRERGIRVAVAAENLSYSFPGLLDAYPEIVSKHLRNQPPRRVARRPSGGARPMSAPAPQALPALDRYPAVLFDLDGVLTPTADLHMHAWRAMFEELFA